MCSSRIKASIGASQASDPGYLQRDTGIRVPATAFAQHDIHK